MLFAARAGQGLGAAMLSPAALSIIMTAFTEGRERARALGAWGAVGGAGAAIGVLLGGTLTELVDWRAIFIINVPIGVALGVGALKVIPADAVRPRWRGLDLPARDTGYRQLRGAGVRAVAGREHGMDVHADARDRRAALVGLVAFAALELHTAQPLLRVRGWPTAPSAAGCC